MRKIIVLISILIINCQIFAKTPEIGSYLKVKPKRGDAIIDLLKRYELSEKNNIEFFVKQNAGNFAANNGLLLHKEYELPILIASYNGKNIRTSLNINDYEIAKGIQDYNSVVHSKGLKKQSYKIDKILWVPFLEFDIENKIQTSQKEPAKKELEKKEVPITKNSSKTIALFGDKVQNFKKNDNKLQNHIFYLIAGHGGPDPGAVGFRDGNELHEHQYAYDVTLRLAKKLMESGAEVYMIVQDENDFIREEKYLPKSGTELLINGDSISPVQVTRLKQRADIVNNLYHSNKKKNQHLLIEVHVDSRITDKRIDIFFYHQPGSDEGKRFCDVLLNTIKEKYDINQPGRGYRGTVTSRNLYTLRNTAPTGVYIELGNIQNPNDQIRLIEPSNRQAIANWLYLGILKAYNK